MSYAFADEAKFDFTAPTGLTPSITDEMFTAEKDGAFSFGTSGTSGVSGSDGFSIGSEAGGFIGSASLLQATKLNAAKIPNNTNNFFIFIPPNFKTCFYAK